MHQRQETYEKRIGCRGSLQGDEEGTCPGCQQRDSAMKEERKPQNSLSTKVDVAACESSSAMRFEK